jgi:hypothetical protein
MRQEPYRPKPREVRWEDFFQPMTGPPADSPVYAPVRDDNHVGATEDLDRQPDGVPHSIIGLTYFFAIVLAILVAVLWVAGSTTGHVAALLLIAFSVPAVVTGLKRKADRDRDSLHRSR